LVLDDKKTIVERLRPHSGQYPLAYALDVAFKLGIRDEFEVLPRFAPKFAADSRLFVFSRRTDGGKHISRNPRGGAAASQQEANR
jgi:hypothetical protein